MIQSSVSNSSELVSSTTAISKVKLVGGVTIVSSLAAVAVRRHTFFAFTGALRGTPTRFKLLKKPVLITLLVGAALYVTWRVFDNSESTNVVVQMIKSQIIDKLKHRPALAQTHLASTFSDLPLNQFKPVLHHAHALSAADRSGASAFFTRFGSSLGLSPYFYEMSNADLRHGRDGSRSYYWAKDVAVAPKALAIPANPLVVMVDVDEYVNMPNFLCSHFCPTLIYTVQPDQVAKTTSNYSYTFDKNNNLVYRTTGSGLYTHPVWNYSVDHVTVSKYCLGVPYRTCIYRVERRATSPDHEMVFFIPLGMWRGLGSILLRWWLQSRDLSRYSVVTPEGYSRLQTCSDAGVFVSTGRPDSYVQAKVLSEIDGTLGIISRTSKYPLTMTQVLSFVEGERISAAPLLEYHRNVSCLSEKPDVVCPLPVAVRTYQFDPCSDQDDAKPSMQAFMNPFINDAFAPAQSIANTIACVEGRIEKVQPRDLPLTPFLDLVMREFAAQLIPDDRVHTYDPVDMEEVYDRQGRPTQRRILEDAEGCAPQRNIIMMLKKEAYSNVKDPRPISMINGPDKRDYSTFLYALEDIMKRQPWYAFGRTPQDIAIAVTQVLENANVALNSDYNRFDGHGSNIMRDLERVILMRAFRVCYHEQLLDLHRAQYNLRAFTRDDIYYDSKFIRGSGSPETSLFNSFVNAFIAFLALRMSYYHGKFLDAKTAYFRLGLYGGDDGLTCDVNPDTYCRAASSVGQKLVVEPVQRGNFGIKFLARVYSKNVWFGDVNSCCDLPRQLSKLHVTVSLGPHVTPIMKLLEKVRSFILTDKNTPILGEFCEAVMLIHQSVIVKDDATAPMRSWLSHVDVDKQYVNDGAEWMFDYVAQVLPDFDYKKFKVWVASANSYDKLLSPPLFQEPTAATSAVPVVVDDTVVPLGARFLPKPARPAKVYKSMRRNEWKAKSAPPTVPVIVNFPCDKPPETFAQARERKMAKGTWVEKSKPKTAPSDSSVSTFPKVSGDAWRQSIPEVSPWGKVQRIT